MIIGHQRIIQYLSRSTALKNLSHAYLFSGPESIGKMMIAMEFAKFCNVRTQRTAGSRLIIAVGVKIVTIWI